MLIQSPALRPVDGTDGGMRYVLLSTTGRHEQPGVPSLVLRCTCPPRKRAQIKSYAEDEEEDDTEHVLCARCYSLRHYG